MPAPFENWIDDEGFIVKSKEVQSHGMFNTGILLCFSEWEKYFPLFSPQQAAHSIGRAWPKQSDGNAEFVGIWDIYGAQKLFPSFLWVHRKNKNFLPGEKRPIEKWLLWNPAMYFILRKKPSIIVDIYVALTAYRSTRAEDFLEIFVLTTLTPVSTWEIRRFLLGANEIWFEGLYGAFKEYFGEGHPILELARETFRDT